MDPIHPIVPVAPAIPTVTPAPLVGRIDRDNAHDGDGQQKRRRRQPNPIPPERDAEDDSGLHIDVTA